MPVWILEELARLSPENHPLCHWKISLWNDTCEFSDGSTLPQALEAASLCPEGSGVGNPMLPAMGSPEVSPGFTDAHQLQRLCQFHLRRGDNKSCECREREGVTRMEWGWQSWAKDMARPNRAAKMGRNRVSPEYFLFYILPPEQHRAADVSDKETEKNNVLSRF